MSSKKKQLFKIIILGDSGYHFNAILSVGKTSLMNQYVNARFTQQYRATVGADFMAKEVMIDDRMVTLQVIASISTVDLGHRWVGEIPITGWSILPGCRLLCTRLRHHQPKGIQNPLNLQSFDSLDSWRDEFLMQGQPKDPENFPFVVLGNKLDKANERKVFFVSIHTCTGGRIEGLAMVQISRKHFVLRDLS